MARALLHGVRIIDFGRGDAARLAATLLCDLGADGVRIADGPGPAPVDAVLERGRRQCSSPSDAEVQRWLSRCDVVVDDGASGLDAEALRSANPGLVWLRIDRSEAATGAAAGAMAGVYAPPLSPRPRWSPLPLADTVAGLLGAIGAVAALVARTRDGRGQDVTVPLLGSGLVAAETLIGMGVRPPASWEGPRWAASPFAAPFRCSDGRWIFVHLGLSQHLDRFLGALVHDGMIRAAGQLARAMSAETRDDPATVGTPAEARDVRGLLVALFEARPAEAWERLLVEAGLCGAVARTGAEWRDHPQAREAGHVVEVRDPMFGQMLQPGPWVRAGDVSAGARREGKPRWGAKSFDLGREDRRPPLAGLRVLDFTQVIAGPVAGRTLAELGADVVRLEHPRFRPAWSEAFHTLFNAGKRSCTVELDPGRSARVLQTLRPDLVLTGWRPGVDVRLGLDPASIRAACPAAATVALDAWGGAGPWGALPGWEQTVQAGTGMQLDYGDGLAELVPLPVNDACTGLATALGAVAALYDQARGGAPADVRCSLASTATWLQREHLFDPAGRAPRRGRGRSLGASPFRRFVRASDGWLWLEGSGDGLRALTGIDPSDESATDSAIRTHPIAHWSARAVGAGVTVAPWYGLGRAADHPSVRRLPQPGVGRVYRVDLPLTLDRTPVLHPESAPRRGGDGPDLLGGAIEVLPPDVLGDRSITGRLRTRRRWLGTTVRWGLELARSRLHLIL